MAFRKFFKESENRMVLVENNGGSPSYPSPRRKSLISFIDSFLFLYIRKKNQNQNQIKNQFQFQKS